MNFDGCKISRRKDCVKIAVAKKVGCLQYLSFQRDIEKCTISKKSSEMLWQRRYGHLSASGMKKLTKDSLVTGFDLNPNNCVDLLVQSVGGISKKRWSTT